MNPVLNESILRGMLINSLAYQIKSKVNGILLHINEDISRERTNKQIEIVFDKE